MVHPIPEIGRVNVPHLALQTEDHFERQTGSFVPDLGFDLALPVDGPVADFNEQNEYAWADEQDLRSFDPERTPDVVSPELIPILTALMSSRLNRRGARFSADDWPSPKRKSRTNGWK